MSQRIEVISDISPCALQRKVNAFLESLDVRDLSYSLTFCPREVFILYEHKPSRSIDKALLCKDSCVNYVPDAEQFLNVPYKSIRGAGSAYCKRKSARIRISERCCHDFYIFKFGNAEGVGG